MNSIPHAPVAASVRDGEIDYLSARLRRASFVVASVALVTCVQVATTVTVDQRGLTFSQRSVALSRGDRMVFANSDDVIHNIHVFTGEGEDERDLGLQKPGVPLAYTFAKAGSFIIRCNVHPSMKILVTVK